MPRCLVMSERTVGEAEREGYLQSLAVRREHAAAASAHFWVFEDKARRGRFLEFVEGPSPDAVRHALENGVRVHGKPAHAQIWEEVAASVR